jgi:hypothetical protein
MNLAKVPAGGYFPIADLVGTLETESETSLSLSVGYCTESRFWAQGWIDVHYPCKDPMKVLVRLNVPNTHHALDRVEAIIADLFDLLSIPKDELYTAHCFRAEGEQVFENGSNTFGRG